MITKHYAKDFASQARTLPASAVSDGAAMGGTHTKTHPSGWTITGEVHEDGYTWVNDFIATHHVHGTVSGDFEKSVTITSDSALSDFLAHHPPEEWDYYDIWDAWQTKTIFMRNRLYKITAHCGSRTHSYYVVAPGTTAAEEGVSKMHRDNGWPDVDHFDAETVADEYTYGKPVPLILANTALS